VSGKGRKIEEITELEGELFIVGEGKKLKGRRGV